MQSPFFFYTIFDQKSLFHHVSEYRGGGDNRHKRLVEWKVPFGWGGPMLDICRNLSRTMISRWTLIYWIIPSDFVVMFAEADQNNDGYIDFDEFVMMMLPSTQNFQAWGSNPSNLQLVVSKYIFLHMDPNKLDTPHAKSAPLQNSTIWQPHILSCHFF